MLSPSGRGVLPLRDEHMQPGCAPQVPQPELMTPPPIPLLLRVYLIATWVLALPMALMSRIAHSRMGAPKARFTERLGRASRQADGPVIWFHAASVGEVTQIAPLAQALALSEKAQILVTTTTASSADWVAREMPDAIHQFASVDTPQAVARFLDSWSIKVALYVEGDPWPRTVLEAQRRGVPLVLLNARHSRTRVRLAEVYRVLLGGFALITCRSQTVADDILSMGLPADRVIVLPDLRLASPPLPAPPDLCAELRRQIGERPVWLAASTHPADEAAVLQAHQHALETRPETLLIWAPRHPKRGGPLCSQLRDAGLSCAQRSAGEALDDTTQVYVADTLGELGAFYSVAPLSFLGGSFGDEGGHNPYEPASFGSAIVAGGRVKNFAAAYVALGDAGAVLQISDQSALGPTIVELMDATRAQDMGRAGRDFIETGDECLSDYLRHVLLVLRNSGQNRP